MLKTLFYTPNQSQRDPLLRTNAKSQAVTGEPFRAGSTPTTSAATTPQPAGRSIANSAAIWRRGINVAYFIAVNSKLRSSIVAISAGMKPDAQPTNRRINRHKTAAKLSTTFCQWGLVPRPIRTSPPPNGRPCRGRRGEGAARP